MFNDNKWVLKQKIGTMKSVRRKKLVQNQSRCVDLKWGEFDRVIHKNKLLGESLIE